MDKKHNRPVVLKISTVEEIDKEREIYLLLEGLSGIPAIYGWCLTNPTNSYVSIQPFEEDLFQYVTVNGPMGLRQACEIVEKVVSVNVLPFT